MRLTDMSRGHRRPRTVLAVALVIMSAAAVMPVCAQIAPTLLEEPAEAPYGFAATLHVDDPATLRLQIFLDYSDPQNTYAITCAPGEVAIERVLDGNSMKIGYGYPRAEFASDSDLELTVRRDGWRIELILDRQVLARAWDSSLSGGQVGYAITGGEIPDAMVQPLGGVFMSDDFMRTEDAVSVWEVVSGTWKTESLRVDEQSERMEEDKSTNAFSYWGKGEGGPAISTAGYWFWNNYQVTAAVRATEADPVGLVAYLQDAENYIAARWTSALSEGEDADRLQLIAVSGGEVSVLAESPGGHLPGQWYQMQLRVCDRLIQCLIDDEPRAVAQADLFGQGQPGLYCEGPGGVFFDSVAVDAWEVLSEDFETPAPGRWVEQAGTWQYAGGGLVSPPAGRRVALSGRAEWSDYWVTSDVSLGGAAGIVLCADESSWYALRFGTMGSGTAYEGQAQIVRVTDGKEEVLSSAPAHLPGGSNHRIRAIVDGGLITGYLDGKRVLDAYDSGAEAGRVGLLAEGNGPVSFDNLYVAMIPPKRIARVTKEFAEDDEHPEMAEWATTRAPWTKPEEEDGAWWTKGDYFGDKTIAFAIPGVEAAEGELRLRLDAIPEEPESGLTLVLVTAKGSRAITATLLAGTETLGEATVETSSDPCPVRFERKGTWVVAAIDGKVIFNEKR